MKPRVRFVASDAYGGGHLRSFWPAEALRGLGYDAKAYQWWPRPDEYDVVISHRPLAPDVLGRIDRYQRHGLTFLVDEDDDLTCIPETNPSARWYQDYYAARHDAAIAAADGLVVSTPRLAEVYGVLNPNVVVCRNHLPAWVGEMRSHTRDDHVRVGWTGTMASHAHDLAWLGPHGPRAFAGAMASVIGDIRCLKVLGAGGGLYEHYPWQHEQPAYFKVMARADIGIVPLDPRPFNLSKSWLKALEYMTLGKPVVATDLPEQRALITHGLDGYLAGDPGTFAEYVQALVHDGDLRERMGEAARARGASLTLETNVGQWDALAQRWPIPSSSRNFGRSRSPRATAAPASESP